MHKGARDDSTLSFATFRKFHFSSTTFVACIFQLFMVTSISNIALWADFVMGQLNYVPSGFGCLFCLFILFNSVFSE